MPAVAPVERPSSSDEEEEEEEEDEESLGLEVEESAAVPSSLALPVLVLLVVGAGTVADASIKRNFVRVWTGEGLSLEMGA
jgi:hypothetical protein